jgi:hypothetical protein
MQSQLLSLFLFVFSDVELSLVILIIAGQLWVGYQAWQKIHLLPNTLPKQDSFRLRTRYASPTELSSIAPREFVRNIDKHTSALALPEYVSIAYIHVDAPSETYQRIGESINTYLVRNKGAVADFNILRDITQRNLDAHEEEITIMLPLPLYLGLLGTMLGVVIGLFSIPVLDIRSFNDGQGISNLSGVNELINGVKFAMIASAVGLLATIINTLLFRGAKIRLERRKQDFFTFLQTYLLPVLTQSVNSGILNLNESFNKFGQKFNQMATRFEQSVAQNYQSLTMQQNILDTIQKIDPARVATYNVTVMKELKSSMGSLERFADFLGTLTTLTDNARQLVERTQNVEQVSTQLRELLTESKALQRFLNSHFDKIEQSGQVVTNAVVKVDKVVDESLNGLASHINERIEAVRKITLTEDNLLIEAFERNRDTLRHLKHLESLQKSITDLSKQNYQAQQGTAAGLNLILEALFRINTSLEKQAIAEENFFVRVWKKINNRG